MLYILERSPVNNILYSARRSKNLYHRFLNLNEYGCVIWVMDVESKAEVMKGVDVAP